jgi:hypothetical protein
MTLPFDDADLHELRQHLVEHPLYQALRTAEDVRVFMRQHVFCVWDFMSLLKALQRRLCCVEVPWLPPDDPRSCRLVNEIVLAEESDDDGAGGHCSHFQLYLAAMHDAGADTSPMDRLLAGLRRGEAVDEALQEAGAPPAVAAFVQHTLELAQSGPLHRLAAGFALGREDIIPAMFLRLLEQLAEREPARFERFLYYLRRHVHLDAEEHGPAAMRLVERLCGDERQRQEAIYTARRCLEMRLRVWDSILQALPV